MGHVCALLEGLRNMMEEIRRTVCIKDKQHKLHVAHLRHGVRKNLPEPPWNFANSLKAKGWRRICF